MSDKRWDLFVSYASEDRDSVAAPLVDHLQRAGLRIWFDNEELRIGDSLRERIDEGLANSRFGVLIISPNFLRKQWPKREFNALWALEEGGARNNSSCVARDIKRRPYGIFSALVRSPGGQYARWFAGGRREDSGGGSRQSERQPLIRASHGETSFTEPD
jgi:hypothetical protein